MALDWQKGPLHVRRARRRLARVLAYCGAFGMPLTLALVGTTGLLRGLPLPSSMAAPFVLMFSLALVVGVGGVVGSFLAGRWSPPRVAASSADERGITLEIAGVRQRISIERIVDGFVLMSDRPQIEVELVDGDLVRIEVESRARARSMLGALGLDPSKRRLSISTEGGHRHAAAGCGGLALGSLSLILVADLVQAAFGNGPSLLAIFIVIPVFLIVFRALLPKGFVIGTDGLLVRGALRQRFVPYGDVVSVSAADRALLVERKSGSKELIPVGVAARTEVESVVERVREAMGTGLEGVETRALRSRLARGERAIGEWKRAVLEVLRPAEGYRDATFEPGDLIGVLEDGAAALDERVGAAVALRASAEPEAARRIRVAADASADDRVRIALGRLAEPEVDEAALEASLLECAMADNQRRTPEVD